MGEELEVKLLRLADELKSRGYKVTAQRLNIAKVLLESLDEHPSFSELLRRVKELDPGVSQSTVYNTLALLEELGFVQSFDFQGETRYDKPHPHVNVLCLDTREVKEPSEEVSREVVELLEERIKVKVRNVLVYSLCGEEKRGS